MKKIKLGSVEILGCIGLLIWAGAVLSRRYPLTDNPTYWFWLGVLPNLGSALLATLFAKWGVIFILKKDITVKVHLLLCLGVLLAVLASEIIHAVFFHSPFDLYDMLMTLAAQLLVFFIPILARDKYFRNYKNKSTAPT